MSAARAMVPAARLAMLAIAALALLGFGAMVLAPAADWDGAAAAASFAEAPRFSLGADTSVPAASEVLPRETAPEPDPVPAPTF